LFIKVIRACINLNIFETAYTFDWSAEFLTKTVRLSDGQSGEAREQAWRQGKLYRITGEFHAVATSASEQKVWDMTCVPAKRKF